MPIRYLKVVDTATHEEHLMDIGGASETDATPTQGSTNPVSSGGVFAEFSKILEAQAGFGLTLAQVTEDGQQVWRWCYNDGT